MLLAHVALPSFLFIIPFAKRPRSRCEAFDELARSGKSITGFGVVRRDVGSAGSAIRCIFMSLEVSIEGSRKGSSFA